MTGGTGRDAPTASRITVPSGNAGVPQIRKKIPAPFARPSISVGSSGPRREWRTVEAHQLKAGDIVPSVGRLASVHEEYYMPTAEEARAMEPLAVLDHYKWDVTVRGVEGNTRVYQGHEPVFAFVFPVEGEWTSTSSPESADGRSLLT